MELVFQHVQEHLRLYLLVTALVVPLLYLFRKQTLPVLYHAAEYFIYCIVFHLLVGAMLRVGTWYRLETSFRNQDGSTAANYEPFTTPLNLHFWEKELYNPQWFFYLEAAVAVGFLYLVIVVRPMRFKKNIYRGRVEEPEAQKKKARQSEALSLSSRRRTDAQRARLQRVRDNR